MCARSISALCFSLSLLAYGALVALGEPPARVVLSLPTSEYLLGEPLELVLAVKNVTEKPLEMLEVLVEDVEPEIRTYISTDGKTFSEYVMGIFPRKNYHPRVIEFLEPGVPRIYRPRVLYAHKPPNYLAFPEARRYWIKVRFPLVPPQPDKAVRVESNTITVDIKEPQGRDAQVWERIRAPEFLYFLQSGLLKDENAETLRQAIELVRALPGSRYAPALKHALQHYLDHLPGRMAELGEGPELDQIRQLLGIPKKPESPFPNEKRLDRKITLQFEQQTPIADIFATVSDITGVRLRVAPTLRMRTSAVAIESMSLRRFMGMYEGLGVWVREPDGAYALLPVPECDFPDNKPR